MILTPTDGTAFVLLDGQPAVFSAVAQKLYALNTEAALIWCGFEEGEPVSSVVDRLVASGANPTDAATYVNQAARKWLRLGLLQVDIASFDGLATECAFTVRLARSTWTFEFNSGSVAQSVLQLFEHHEPPLENGNRLKIIESKGLVYIFDNDKCVLTCVMDDVVPSTKAYLTEQLVLQCAPDIAFHAACLEHNAKALLISGSPGAGKTTLALYLVQRGLACCADDIVLIRPDGTVTGVPFAPTIKSGAWRILEGSVPDLKDVPIHRRRDSKRVKYLNSLGMAANGSVYRVGWIVFLKRRSRGDAKLVPLGRLDVLKRVIASSNSPNGRMSHASLVSFKTMMLTQADLFELSYSNVAEAGVAILRMSDGKS